MEPVKIVAVLGWTLMRGDGDYNVVTLNCGCKPLAVSESGPSWSRTHYLWMVGPCLLPDRMLDLSGVPHYVGHPSTARIAESLGAVDWSDRKFQGLDTGEAALCLVLRPDTPGRTIRGSTVDREVGFDDLEVRLLRRVR